MSNAKMDENSRASLTALSSVDGSTIVPLYADPTTHRLLVDASASFTILTTSSTIDDSNLTFVFTGTPTLVNINGAFYNAGATAGGVVVWTNVGTTVTLAFPVGTGGCIFGL